MKSRESFVSAESDYYVYVPSRVATDMLFYPLYTGRFIYEPGYSLRRDSYDSFLLIYIRSGRLTVELDDQADIITAGSFVLIDCYKPHSYRTETGCEALWCHFDGPSARAYYEMIVQRIGGNSVVLREPANAVKALTAIYDTFHNGEVIHEALFSKHITDILTELCLYVPGQSSRSQMLQTSDVVISYIGEHFAEDVPVEQLAQLAGLSKFHFIRAFKRDTGFTPHEYIIHVRINTAKYLLKNSRLSIREICSATGFSGESVFCSSFKKHVGLTPLEYRTLEGK